MAEGSPSRIVQLAEDRQVQVFASLDILDEIHRVLRYEKIARILKRSGKEPSSIMATIVSLCSLVDVKSKMRAIQEDPTDNQALACAKDARADFVISGDRHLLELREFENVRVLTATDLLEKRRRANAR